MIKANKHLRQYEEDLKLKLGIHKVYHRILSKMRIHNHIDTAKLGNDGSLDNTLEIQKANLTFSYDKLKRLKSFYQILVEFTLQIIHTFMYIDTQKCDWDEIIKDVLPIILNLKKQLEMKITSEMSPEILKKLLKNVEY